MPLHLGLADARYDRAMSTLPASALPTEPAVVVVAPRPRSRWYMTLPLMIGVAALAVLAWQQPPDGQARGEPIFRFVGRLHPALTHLPIGLLILMPILDLLGVFHRARHLWASGQLVLWIATLGTIVAAASGYLLARYDGESGEDLLDHQWAGIATAGACCFALLFRSLARGGKRRKTWGFLYLLTLLYTLVCVAAAGHLGGKLVHGDDYLTEYAPEPIRKLLGEIDDVDNLTAPIPATLPAPQPTTKPAVDVSVAPTGATVFAAVIQPIFAQHCVECHGEKKIKGGLRLDTFALAMAGGESGSTITPRSVADSELVRLMKLPTTDDDVMPPAKKPRLTPAEIAAVEWWIANGAAESQKLSDAALPDDIRALAR